MSTDLKAQHTLSVTSPFACKFPHQGAWDTVPQVSEFRGRIIKKLVYHTEHNHRIRKLFYSIVNALILFSLKRAKNPSNFIKHQNYLAHVAHLQMHQTSQKKQISSFNLETQVKFKETIDLIESNAKRQSTCYNHKILFNLLTHLGKVEPENQTLVKDLLKKLLKDFLSKLKEESVEYTHVQRILNVIKNKKVSFADTVQEFENHKTEKNCLMGLLSKDMADDGIYEKAFHEEQTNFLRGALLQRLNSLDDELNKQMEQNRSGWEIKRQATHLSDQEVEEKILSENDELYNRYNEKKLRFLGLFPDAFKDIQNQLSSEKPKNRFEQVKKTLDMYLQPGQDDENTLEESKETPQQITPDPTLHQSPDLSGAVEAEAIAAETKTPALPVENILSPLVKNEIEQLKKMHDEYTAFYQDVENYFKNLQVYRNLLKSQPQVTEDLKAQLDDFLKNVLRPLEDKIFNKLNK